MILLSDLISFSYCFVKGKTSAIIEQEGTILVNPDGSLEVRNFVINGGSLNDLANIAKERVLLAAERIKKGGK